MEITSCSFTQKKNYHPKRPHRKADTSTMDANSTNLDNEISTVLKDIAIKDRLAVFGYVREEAFNANKIFIPDYIINFCIVYLFAVFERFDGSKNWDNVDLDEEKSIITSNHLFGNEKDWKNTFGKAIISMKTGIHEWKFKLFGHSMHPFVIIGIVPLDIINNHDVKESDKYKFINNRASNNWFINEYWRGHAYHVGNGWFYERWRGQKGQRYFDTYSVPLFEQAMKQNTHEKMVTMVFDTDNGTLRYLVDGKESSRKYGMENITKQKYQMAVSYRFEVSVQLISYQRYDP